MEIVNNNTDTSKLTNRDLALAAYSLAELYNVYVRAMEDEAYDGSMSREQLEEAADSIRAAHIKFDSILEASRIRFEAEHGEDADDSDDDSGEESDE